MRSPRLLSLDNLHPHLLHRRLTTHSPLPPPLAPQMKKQAENLRYIMEAPKLEISPDERVTIPLLNNQDSWRRDA